MEIIASNEAVHANDMRFGDRSNKEIDNRSRYDDPIAFRGDQHASSHEMERRNLDRGASKRSHDNFNPLRRGDGPLDTQDEIRELERRRHFSMRSNDPDLDLFQRDKVHLQDSRQHIPQLDKPRRLADNSYRYDSKQRETMKERDNREFEHFSDKIDSTQRYYHGRPDNICSEMPYRSDDQSIHYDHEENDSKRYRKYGFNKMFQVLVDGHNLGRPEDYDDLIDYLKAKREQLYGPKSMRETRVSHNDAPASSDLQHQRLQEKISNLFGRPSTHGQARTSMQSGENQTLQSSVLDALNVFSKNEPPYAMNQSQEIPGDNTFSPAAAIAAAAAYFAAATAAASQNQQPQIPGQGINGPTMGNQVQSAEVNNTHPNSTTGNTFNQHNIKRFRPTHTKPSSYRGNRQFKPL